MVDEISAAEREAERLKTLYIPTPTAYAKALEILKLLGHRTAAAWTRFNVNDDPSILCHHCNTTYVLGGSYGAPIYYLNIRTTDPGVRGELFDAATVLYFSFAPVILNKELVKNIPPHFYCK